MPDRTGSRASQRLLVTAAMLLAIPLLSCNTEASDGGVPATEHLACEERPLGPPGDKTDVLLWHALSARPRDALAAHIHTFNNSQTRVRVRAESQGSSYDELLAAYLRGIPERQLPDIAIMEHTSTKLLIESGTLLPVDKCFQASNLPLDAYDAAATAYFSNTGKLYAASAGLSQYVTYYNKRLFRQAGVDISRAPSTLAEVTEVARRLQRAGVESPVVLKLGPWFVEAQLAGLRVPLFDNDNGRGDGQTTTSLYRNSEARSVVHWLQDMHDQGLLEVKPDVPGQIDHFLAMLRENAAITVESSAAANTLDTVLPEESRPEQSTLTKADVGVGPIFGVRDPGKSQLGGNGFFLTNTNIAARQAGAWEFMRWWNRPEQQDAWRRQASYLPFLRPKEPSSPGPPQGRVTDAILTVAHRELTEGVDPGFPGPSIGPSHEVTKRVRAGLDRIVFEHQDVEQELDRTSRDVDELLTRYNAGR